ncbi:ABC transporter ATP-binding protein [Halorientalis halophila]|uniref:ABC transporter ATP-binding protein n=1 Tax=Halorientalis halophila TaxID=3108499 RepID=UPI0030088061
MTGRTDADANATPDEEVAAPALAMRNVTKTYGDVTALSGVDLTVAPGTIHALVGPNGSGKTTLFRIALGLTRPSSGTVDGPAGGIGPGFQRANVYRDLSVAENLDVFGAMTGGVDEDWRERLVETLRLSRVLNRRVGDLSGGFRQKLDLALAMLARPPVVFLDEPLGDLDDVSRANLLDLLAAYRDDGNAVVVSTHHVDAFADVLDRLTVLRDGTVLLDEDRTDVDLGEHDSLQALYVARTLAADGESADLI